MSTKSMRKEFEAWCLKEGRLPQGLKRTAGGAYFYGIVQSDWEAWQAASAGREELLDALQRTTDMLESACHFVSKNAGLMQMLNEIERARALLSKYRPQESKEDSHG